MISQIFDVPLAYVYGRCTDFTNDDPKIIGAPNSRHIVEKTKKRAVWIQHHTRDGVGKKGSEL
ncbi:MAG: hypothetical protein M1368_09580 [Thaumarchaeota archaeon]|nr:hypothetical protein [Nitrososphaerota archaeon]